MQPEHRKILDFLKSESFGFQERLEAEFTPAERRKAELVVITALAIIHDVWPEDWQKSKT